MDYSLEISKLESHTKIVKILAKITILSMSFTLIVLFFGFNGWDAADAINAYEGSILFLALNVKS